MNKTIKNIILTVIFVTMIFFFTGCGSPKEIQNPDPVNIAFVVGIADNETKFNTGIKELENISAAPGTDYAFISVEGEPGIIGEAGTIPDFSDRGYTNTMMERVRAGIRADLEERLTSYEPVSPEIDLAAATDCGVRTLNAHAVDGRKNVLVYYCSGKSTKGLINMLDTPLYGLDAEASAKEVAQKMNLNMSSIDVVWYCAGDFGTVKLPAEEKTKLKDFYGQLFKEFGAKSVTFKDDLPSSECYHFPSAPVSDIAVKDTESGLKDMSLPEQEISEETVTEDAGFEEPIVISEEQVRYKPGSVEFSDPDAAAAAIQPVANFLMEHPELNVVLYGTCAGDTDSDYTIGLGKSRAESVKQVLVAAGIEESRITAVTVKVADDIYHQYGLGTGSEADVNRKTVIIPDSYTPFAQQILEKAL